MRWLRKSIIQFLPELLVLAISHNSQSITHIVPSSIPGEMGATAPRCPCPQGAPGPIFTISSRFFYVPLWPLDSLAVPVL